MGDIGNVPGDDPIVLLLEKNQQNNNNPPDMSGAEFTYTFYGGYYNSKADAENAAKNGVLKRTFVAQTTDLNYKYRSSIAWKDSFIPEKSDALFISAAGTATFPLGTLFIEETKAPDGFKVADETLIVQFTEDGMKHINFSSNRIKNDPDSTAIIVKDKEVRGGISIQKWNYEVSHKGSQGNI